MAQSNVPGDDEIVFTPTLQAVDVPPEMNPTTGGHDTILNACV